MVLTVSEGRSSQLLFSSDGRWLIGAGNDSVPQRWDLASPDPACSVQIFPGHTNSEADVLLSRDARWLITTGEYDHLRDRSEGAASRDDDYHQKGQYRQGLRGF